MSPSFTDAPSFYGARPLAVLVDVGFTLTFWDGARIAQHAAAAGVPVEPAAIERAEILIRGETREVEGVPLRTHDDGGHPYLDRVFPRPLPPPHAPRDDASLARPAAHLHGEHPPSDG